VVRSRLLDGLHDPVLVLEVAVTVRSCPANALMTGMVGYLSDVVWFSLQVSLESSHRLGVAHDTFGRQPCRPQATKITSRPLTGLGSP
jgi:hypothetical protein